MVISETKISNGYTLLVSYGECYPLISINILDCIGLTTLSFMMSQDMIKEFFNDVDHCINEAESFIFKMPYDGIKDLMINLIYNDEDSIIIKIAQSDGLSIYPTFMVNSNTELVKDFFSKIEIDMFNGICNYA